jgi:AraC family transcriptional regulator
MVAEAVKERLRAQYRTLDPVALLAEIRAAQEELGNRIDRRAGGALRENAGGKSDMVVHSSTAEPAAFARELGNDLARGEPRATHRRPKRRYKKRIRMPSKLDPHVALEGWLAAEPQLSKKTALPKSDGDLSPSAHLIAAGPGVMPKQLAPERHTTMEPIARVGELHWAQEDGGPPTTLAAGGAPGESGVSVFRARFEGGMHFTSSARQHQICFQLSPALRIDRRLAGRTLRHESAAGMLSICPAGMDCGADGEATVDSILVAIEPRHLALAAAENSALEAHLIECLSGHDQALFELASILAGETADNYPNGLMFWNEIANRFIGVLIAHHTRQAKLRVRGSLGKEVLARLRDYVVAHLDEPIEVAALASMAGRSPFHFTRVFARSVGVTPYRYVVHLRLQRAVELLREGKSGLAEIAAATGFADQSHLSRWVRRVYGVSPSQFAA